MNIRIKSKSKMFVLFMFCTVLIISCCGFSVFSQNQYTIDTPYEYPAQPGTEEWSALDGRSEKAEACQIPEEILENMTTEALVYTVLNYPFMIDIYAYNYYSEEGDSYLLAMESIATEFNGLQELKQRPDAVEVIETIEEADHFDTEDYPFHGRYLSVVKAYCEN